MGVPVSARRCSACFARSTSATAARASTCWRRAHRRRCSSGRRPGCGDPGERRVGFVLGLRRHDPAPDAAEAAPPVDRLVPCDRQQPCLETRLAAKTVQPAEGEQERILRGVFRIRRRSQRRQRRAIDRRPMPLHELAERGRIALPGSGYQVGIGHTGV